MISHNEALERLWECVEISRTDPLTAHYIADSVLLELIADDEIRERFQMIDRGYTKLKADHGGF